MFREGSGFSAYDLGFVLLGLAFQPLGNEVRNSVSGLGLTF